MGTVASVIESARYDLIDYEKGIEFDDRVLFLYVNRLIDIMDSALASLHSDYIHGVEEDIDTVADQNYVDLTYMNNGQWDSIRNVWIGQDRKYKRDLDNIMYKRKFRDSSAEPNYWTTRGKQLLFECDADDAHTDLVIEYNKKHRDRLQSWSDTFTASATTDALTLTSGTPTFVTGDGPFTVSNSGGSLPAGLAASTNYWLVFQPDDPDGIQLATSKVNAIESSVIDITNTGSGTHTITLGSDMMPYDGAFDNMILEMVVMHARSKAYGKIGQPDALYQEVFRKRAMEETIRRKFVQRYYRLDY